MFQNSNSDPHGPQEGALISAFSIDSRLSHSTSSRIELQIGEHPYPQQYSSRRPFKHRPLSSALKIQLTTPIEMLWGSWPASARFNSARPIRLSSSRTSHAPRFGRGRQTQPYPQQQRRDQIHTVLLVQLLSFHTAVSKEQREIRE
jgi:hypothetical protein